MLLSPLSDAASFLAGLLIFDLRSWRRLSKTKAKAADLSLKRKDVGHTLHCCNQEPEREVTPPFTLSPLSCAPTPQAVSLGPDCGSVALNTRFHCDSHEDVNLLQVLLGDIELVQDCKRVKQKRPSRTTA